MEVDSASHAMTLNAIHNILLSTGDIINRPNRAAVQIYTAIELILKARLCEEHWSLVVSKNPDKDKFDSGDFISVTFEEACKRLEMIVKDPVPPKAKNAFDDLRKIRNKIVHFYTDDMRGDRETTQKTRETLQCAWNHLHGVICTTWYEHFSSFVASIDAVEKNPVFTRNYNFNIREKI